MTTAVICLATGLAVGAALALIVVRSMLFEVREGREYIERWENGATAELAARAEDLPPMRYVGRASVPNPVLSPTTMLPEVAMRRRRSILSMDNEELRTRARDILAQLDRDMVTGEYHVDTSVFDEIEPVQGEPDMAGTSPVVGNPSTPPGSGDTSKPKGSMPVPGEPKCPCGQPLPCPNHGKPAVVAVKLPSKRKPSKHAVVAGKAA